MRRRCFPAFACPPSALIAWTSETSGLIARAITMCSSGVKGFGAIIMSSRTPILARLSAKESLILDLLARGEELYGLQLVAASKGRLKRGTVYVTLDRLDTIRGHLDIAGRKPVLDSQKQPAADAGELRFGLFEKDAKLGLFHLTCC